MIERINEAVEFKYSVQKLTVRAVAGVVLIIAGVVGIVVLLDYLSEMRAAQIDALLNEEIYIFPRDPAWAVIAQLGAIAFSIIGIYMIVISIFYMVSRERVFLRITGTGIQHFRVIIHIIKVPRVEETYFDWPEIADVSMRRNPFGSQSVIITNAGIRKDSKHRKYEISTSYSEQTAEEIMQAITKERLKVYKSS